MLIEHGDRRSDDWYWLRDRDDPEVISYLEAENAYADAMLDILRRWVPLTWESFQQHRLHAVTFSASALAVVKRMLGGEAPTQEDSGLSKREWRELMAALGREA